MGRKKKIVKDQQHKQQQQEEKAPLQQVTESQPQDRKGQSLASISAPKSYEQTDNPPPKKHNHKSNHQHAPSQKSLKRSESARQKYPHYTWEQVGKHDHKDDVWVVIEDSIYDVTKVVDHHPGGPKAIMHRAGKDATKKFHKGHHPYHVLEEKLPKLMVGRIKSDSSIQSWQRQGKTGKMDLFCVSALSLILFTSLVFLIAS